MELGRADINLPMRTSGRVELLGEADAGPFKAKLFVEGMSLGQLLVARDLKYSAASIGEIGFSMVNKGAADPLASEVGRYHQGSDSADRFWSMKHNHFVQRCGSDNLVLKIHCDERQIAGSHPKMPT